MSDLRDVIGGGINMLVRSCLLPDPRRHGNPVDAHTGALYSGRNEEEGSGRVRCPGAEAGGVGGLSVACLRSHPRGARGQDWRRT